MADSGDIRATEFNAVANAEPKDMQELTIYVSLMQIKWYSFIISYVSLF